jgi:antirestriction protein ArdC
VNTPPAATNASERHAELLEQLHNQTEALRTSEGWQRWLSIASRFTEYSLNNQLLILMQRPDASRVADYKTWQTLGRHVNEGERGIAIFAPLTRRVGDDNDDERRRVLTGFKVVRVFDISQTSGEPLPTLTVPDTAGSSESLFEDLVAVAQAEQLEVRRQTEPSDWDGPRGWIEHENRTITLVDYGQGVDNMTRTLLHELGHHCDPACHLPGNDTPVREVVAESAAWLVGTGALGLAMNDASTTYVASWLEATEIPAADFMAQLADHSLRVAKRLETLVTQQLDAASTTDDQRHPISEKRG